MGFVGIGIATALTNLCNLIGTLVYTSTIKEIQEAVFWPDLRSYSNYLIFFQIGLPSAFMFILDVWAGSSMRFVSGYFGVEVQSSQIVLNSILMIMYMISVGLDSGACTIVGR